MSRIRALMRILKFCLVLLSHGVKIMVASRRSGSVDEHRRIATLQSAGAAALCRTLGITVSVNGRLSTTGPTLIVCNHPGLLDPWILASRLSIAFVAKSEMGSWPLFGPIGRACGLIFADRSNPKLASKLIAEIQDRMAKGVPVLLFPEGTTSGEDRVLSFKTGAFAAVESSPDAVIQPLYLWPEFTNGRPSTQADRERVYWPRDEAMLVNASKILSVRSIHFEILVGEPIQAAGRDRKELAQLAHSQIETLERATRIT